MRVTTRQMTTIGLLVGISVVFTRFLSPMLPIFGIQGLRIGFGPLPIMLAGLLMGPLAGGITGALADFIGGILFPAGPYFPGFTLSSATWGFLLPLLLRLFPEAKQRFWPLVAGVLVTSMVVSGLNTLWLTIMFERAFWVLLPTRLLTSLVQVPIHALILHYAVKGYSAYGGTASHQVSR
ncbi:MAG: folate family ECF transporter S component [Firmicutes bacterium]|nr:folate family ECF transporter S component [Bacillota bacterium]